MLHRQQDLLHSGYTGRGCSVSNIALYRTQGTEVSFACLLCEYGRQGLQLNRIADRLRDSQDIPFSYDEAVVNLIASRCTEIESGGRMVDAILTQTMLPEISREFLTRTMEGNPVKGVQVGVKDAQFTYAFS